MKKSEKKEILEIEEEEEEDFTSGWLIDEGNCCFLEEDLELLEEEVFY